MAMAFLFHLPLVLLLLSFFLFSTVPAAEQSKTPILDSDGDPVRLWTTYYAIEHLLGPIPPVYNGLGMTLANDTSCLWNVYLQTRSNGHPVMFYTMEPGPTEEVYLGEPLYVSFPGVTNCTNSDVWKLDAETMLVSTGGAGSNSDVNYSRFKVVKDDEAYHYHFMACPGPRDVVCYTLGVIGKDRLLGVSNRALAVMFTKVSNSNVGSATA